MADEEQLAILRQGVEAWNAWRGEHPKIHVDFTDANFAFTNFAFTNLAGANLSGAGLGGADFAGAKLGRANLSFANLDPTNLRGADLARADFTGARLRGVNFAGAVLFETIFVDIDLSGCQCPGYLPALWPELHRPPHLATLRPAAARLPARRRPAGQPPDRLPALAAEPGDPAVFLLHQLQLGGQGLRSSATRRLAGQGRTLLVRARGHEVRGPYRGHDRHRHPAPRQAPARPLRDLGDQRLDAQGGPHRACQGAAQAGRCCSRSASTTP